MESKLSALYLPDEKNICVLTYKIGTGIDFGTCSNCAIQNAIMFLHVGLLSCCSFCEQQ